MVKNTDWMEAAWAEKGVKAPAAFQQAIEESGLDDEPELDWLEQQYVTLFNVASTCRPSSYAGVAPIPYTAIAEVLDRHGWAGAEFTTAAHLLRLMDVEMLDHYADHRSR